MTKEQEEAIEIIDKMIKSYIEADECGLSNNDFKHEIRAMKTVLNMLQEQQEANKKKDKIIDLMAEWISERCFYKDDYSNSCEIIQDSCSKEDDCKDCIKQYFENKVKE